VLVFDCKRLHKVGEAVSELGEIAVVLANFWNIFDIFNPHNWFRTVPEGMEFLGVLFTILGSLGIMVLLGAWWSR